MSTVVWEHEQGVALVTELPGGRRLIEVEHRLSEAPCRHTTVETAYPLDLIRAIFDAKGPVWLCDDILSEETPKRRSQFQAILFAYLEPEAFCDKTMLEFGCGTGGSTMHLARIFPGVRIVGVELLAEMLSVARRRAEYYGFDRISFHQSPSATELPGDLPNVDILLLPAVDEHMLPNERQALLPQLWSKLRTGGVLFVFGTPNRWWLVETHTSKLPLLNYLPPKPALSYARRLSKRVARDESWHTLLRRGIRGGSVSELTKLLSSDPSARPFILRPSRTGFRTRIDLCWCKEDRPRGWSRLGFCLLKAIETATGFAFVSDLEVAIVKEPR